MFTKPLPAREVADIGPMLSITRSRAATRLSEHTGEEEAAAILLPVLGGRYQQNALFNVAATRTAPGYSGVELRLNSRFELKC
jgi:hypothetical protein